MNHGQNDDPRPVGEIDTELAATLVRFHKLRWWAVVALAVVMAIAITVGAVTLTHQQRQLVASCSLYSDLGTLSVKPTPPIKKPSQAIVTIVVDARRAYLGECGPYIPPASASLLYWARFYHLQIPEDKGQARVQP